MIWHHQKCQTQDTTDKQRRYGQLAVIAPLHPAQCFGCHGVTEGRCLASRTNPECMPPDQALPRRSVAALSNPAFLHALCAFGLAGFLINLQGSGPLRATLAGFLTGFIMKTTWVAEMAMSNPTCNIIALVVSMRCGSTDHIARSRRVRTLQSHSKCRSWKLHQQQRRMPKSHST